MPVHLGSMDRSVETIIRLNRGDVSPGDVFALNAPYNGGTHLPDITVVTPVFDDAREEILFWVASRGHHADVGGTAPGSMTPLATSVDEEGVLFDNFRLVERGRFREAELVTLLTDHPYPARNPRQNVADLKAQIAANEKGVAELRKMVTHFGLAVVDAYMGHVQDNAAESVRRVLDRLPAVSECEYPTDTGQAIRVKITIDRARRQATVDFTGTSPGHEEQLQRARAGRPRGGALRFPRHGRGQHPDERRVPEADRHHHPRRLHAASRLSGGGGRRQCRDLAARHQRAVRARMKALANGQGTMNNLTFGNAHYQYYETICSGSPAGRMNDGRGFDGTSGVHTHMTNSRLTDPEILELRFPVLLEDFHIREGSGGKGRWKAGDGTRRTIRFLEGMECAILSSHRGAPPRGIEGGGDGAPGTTEIRRLDGRLERLKGCDQTTVQAGEAVIVTTPTAGGFGANAIRCGCGNY